MIRTRIYIASLAALAACCACCEVSAESQSAGLNSRITVVGRLPEANKEKTTTVSRGHVITVGRSSRHSSLSALPATIILKLTAKEAASVPENELTAVVKSFDFTLGLDWNATNSSIDVIVDTSRVSAEDAGRQLKSTLESKLRIRILEVRVRR